MNKILLIFKTKRFDKFAQQNNIHDSMLIEAVDRAEKGLIDANLGSNVIKQRIARKGQGKSSGYRTLIIIRSGEKAFFVHGFSKNDQDNLSYNEENWLKSAAKYLLSEDILRLLASGEFLEVKENDKNIQK